MGAESNWFLCIYWSFFSTMLSLWKSQVKIHSWVLVTVSNALIKPVQLNCVFPSHASTDIRDEWNGRGLLCVEGRNGMWRWTKRWGLVQVKYTEGEQSYIFRHELLCYHWEFMIWIGKWMYSRSWKCNKLYLLLSRERETERDRERYKERQIERRKMDRKQWRERELKMEKETGWQIASQRWKEK